MARDRKLNALQHTAAHLRHRIAKLREDDADEEAAAADAAAANAPAPASRGKRKLTRDPNPAFKKRSMNFS